MHTLIAGRGTEPMRESPDPWVEIGPTEWVWISVDSTEVDVINRWAERFHWDKTIVEDMLDDRPESTLIRSGDDLFMVFQALGSPDPRVTSIEVDCFLGDRVLVTVLHGRVAEIDNLRTSATVSGRVAQGGPDQMLGRVARVIAQPYLGVITSLDDRIESIEDRSIARDPSVVSEIQTLRTDLTRIRRLVAPQRDLLATLARDQDSVLITPNARDRLGDVLDQLLRTTEAIDGSRLVLAGALETYRSSVAEDMNQVMKTLTVFSAIMLPLTLMAGIWGMNFTIMPELDQPWGYFAALASMSVVGVGTWSWFAIRGYVGQVRLSEVPKAIGLGLLEIAFLPARGIERAVRALDRGDEPRND